MWRIEWKEEWRAEGIEIWKEEWLKYIYIWNVLDPKHETTYCPNCYEILIERIGYIWDNVKKHWNKSWICYKCGFEIPWVWE